MPERPTRDDDRWQTMKSAPRDGSPVWLWIVHPLARYERDPIEAGYEAAVEAHWIDHNGGGFTWYGLAGVETKWMPRELANADAGRPVTLSAQGEG